MMDDQHVPQLHERLECACALGWVPPANTFVEPLSLDEHYRTRVEQIASHLSVRECIDFTLACAKRHIPKWNEFRAGDPAPSNAIAAVESWLRDPASVHDFQLLAERADQARLSLDYPEFIEDQEPERYAAMEAAEAAGCVAAIVGHYLASDLYDEIFASSAEIVGEFLLRQVSKAVV